MMPTPLKKSLIELFWYEAPLVAEGVTDCGGGVINDADVCEEDDVVAAVDSNSTGDEQESGEIEGVGVVLLLLLLVVVVNPLTLSL